MKQKTECLTADEFCYYTGREISGAMRTLFADDPRFMDDPTALFSKVRDIFRTVRRINDQFHITRDLTAAEIKEEKIKSCPHDDTFTVVNSTQIAGYTFVTETCDKCGYRFEERPEQAPRRLPKKESVISPLKPLQFVCKCGGPVRLLLDIFSNRCRPATVESNGIRYANLSEITSAPLYDGIYCGLCKLWIANNMVHFIRLASKD